jgi:hypothetical protein
MKMKSPQLKRTTFLPGFMCRQGGLLLIALVIQAILSSFGAPAETVAPRFDVNQTPEWTLYTTVRNVDFYYRIADCSGKKVVLMKFNNRNAQRVKVTWKEVFNTQFEAQKEGFRGTKQLTLPTGETSQTDCANIRVKELVVLPGQVNPTYQADIKRFNFKNITVVNL